MNQHTHGNFDHNFQSYRTKPDGPKTLRVKRAGFCSASVSAAKSAFVMWPRAITGTSHSS